MRGKPSAVTRQVNKRRRTEDDRHLPKGCRGTSTHAPSSARSVGTCQGLSEKSSDLYGQGETFIAAYTYGNALLRRNSEYALYNGHGSERTVTAGSQSVSGAINFEAFGQTAGSTGSSSSPYMYAGAWGYRTDGDAGFMHVGARYYDAPVGRFITRDTVLSEHPYLYCEHDAVNWVDPSGHATWWWYAGGVLRFVLLPVAVGTVVTVAVYKLRAYLVKHGNDHDGFGSGHGGIRPGPGDFDSLYDKWMQEVGQ